MPVTVVGRTPRFCGKTIYEIACNLKNFGAGRIVVRNAFLRYKEPSYYKLVKVEPAMDKDFRRGIVLAETVFRGKNFGVLRISGGKSDYNLIPKSEEKALYERLFEPLEERILPQFTEFPPLLKFKIMEEQAAKGEPVTEPKLKRVYVIKPSNRARVAADGEIPNVQFSKHVSLNLYEGVLDTSKQ